MSDETQKLMFNSEEDREKAMDELEDSPENLEKLQEIIDAPIKEAEGEPDNKPPENPEEVSEDISEEEVSEKEKSLEKSSKEGEPADKPPEEPTDKIFTIKPEDLPLNYDTPGKAFKSIKEKEDLIERQGKKIQSLYDEMEKFKTGQPSSRPPEKPADKPPEKPAEVGESKIEEIARLKQEIASSDDQFDDSTIKKRIQLDGLMTDELTRSANIINNLQNEVKTVKKSSSEFQEKFNEDLQKKKNEELVANEYKQIDEFAGNNDYKEFKLVKPSKDVESDYIEWGKQVATLYFGRKPANINEIHHALDILANRPPDLLKKCEEARVPVEPTEDVKNYIKICELLDYRDGYRIKNGQRIRLTKIDPYTKEEVPDTFPTLKAAIEYKRAEEGYYKQKETDAFKNGGKQMADAIKKRDDTELDNSQTGRAPDQQSIEEMIKEYDNFDEEKAVEMYRKGDTSYLDKHNELRKRLGEEPIVL